MKSLLIWGLAGDYAGECAGDLAGDSVRVLEGDYLSRIGNDVH